MTRQLDAIDELLRRGADIDARRMDGARPIHLTNGDYFYRGWRDVPRNWPVIGGAGDGAPAVARRHSSICRPRVTLAIIDRVRELLRQDPSLANRLGESRGLLPRRRRAARQMPPRPGAWTSCSCCSITAPIPTCPKSRSRRKGKALYSAVFNGHYDIAKLLLERGAFPNPPVESSGDALWVSRELQPGQAHGAVAPLVRRDTDARRRRTRTWPAVAHNWLRISPLHEAARNGDVEKAKKLLDAGADLTARDEHLRSTPLAWAAKFGQLEMVTFLLERGAPKQPARRSGVGDAARVGEEARARGDRPPVAAIEHV